MPQRLLTLLAIPARNPILTLTLVQCLSVLAILTYALTLTPTPAFEWPNSNFTVNPWP